MLACHAYYCLTKNWIYADIWVSLVYSQNNYVNDNPNSSFTAKSSTNDSEYTKNIESSIGMSNDHTETKLNMLDLFTVTIRLITRLLYICRQFRIA